MAGGSKGNRLHWRWSNKGAAQELIKSFEKEFVLNGNQSYSFRLDAEIYADALIEFITFNETVTWHLVLKYILVAGASLRAQNKHIDPEELLKKAQELYRTECAETTKYYVVFPILPLIGLSLINTRINGANLRFYHKCPSKYKFARKNLLSRYHNKLDEDVDSTLEYHWCVVSVCSHNPETAFNDAYSAINVYRGLHEVSVLKQFSVRGGRGTAVDYERPTVLPLGRYYSTHLSTGRLASTLVWCQENYKTPSTKPGRCHESLNLLIKKHLKLYKKSKFSEHLSKTLNALMDSVDIATPEYRYLKLHTAIEIMVGSDKSETINKRLSFPPLSSHYNEKLILALRGSRNKLVHAGVSSEIANNDINVKIYLLTMLASHYIGFMLANHYGYQTLDGFLNFTSMRYDSKLVDRQMQDLKNLKAING